MTAVIIIFGALTLVAGLIIIANPEILFGFLNKHIKKIGLHIAAVVVRLILGVLLIVQSDVSRFPLIIEIIGWISIVAAMTFMVIGRSNFKRLMSRALSVTKPYSRIGGIFAALFGAFLIYAFL